MSTPTDEYVLESPRLQAFIEQVRDVQAREVEPLVVIDTIRPLFADLLADKSWLPAKYQEPSPDSGMGSGIGQWLLYRAGDGSLALSALVVPSGASTPVHDHLAWGLVGLYRGTQDEETFARRDDASDESRAVLEMVDRHALVPGDFYALLPETDIHRVTTTSDVTSVSLHLLGIDNGCIWRHRFHPDEQRVEPFRSGYVNQPCAE